MILIVSAPIWTSGRYGPLENLRRALDGAHREAACRSSNGRAGTKCAGTNRRISRALSTPSPRSPPTSRRRRCWRCCTRSRTTSAAGAPRCQCSARYRSGPAGLWRPGPDRRVASVASSAPGGAPFVLLPICDFDPDWRHPVTGPSVDELAEIGLAKDADVRGMDCQPMNWPLIRLANVLADSAFRPIYREISEASIWRHC